jgi:hypothetical protein
MSLRLSPLESAALDKIRESFAAIMKSALNVTNNVQNARRILPLRKALSSRLGDWDSEPVMTSV